MITDEQLIERLRSGMHAAAADVTAPYELLGGISPSPRRTVRLPSFGGIVGLVATVSTIAVAVLAVALLGHQHRVAPQTVAPARPPVAGASTLAQLRSQLAILRRPQRAEDRLSASEVTDEQRQICSACLNVAKLIPGETRLLTTIRVPRTAPEGGLRPERVYLVIGTVPKAWGNGLISGWQQSARSIRGLHLSLVGFTREGPRVAEPIDEVLNPASLAIPAETLTPRAVLITSLASVGVVPDGVTRVKWELDNPGQRTPVTVYPRVVGNVAIAPWTPAPRSTRLINEQLLAGATWYGRDGHVIASFSVSPAVIDRAHRAGAAKPPAQ